jgi:hypothetical protein
VFPLLFASVLGRAVHAILLWRLEKGERIGILDTLAGSTSLISTVTSQLQLRRVNLLGVALIAVWALSPIGGQGSIRQTTIREDISVQPTPFNYVVPHGNMSMHIQDFDNSYEKFLETVFIGALVGPPSIKSSPLDAWGNIKVPRIEHYENISQADDEGWYDTQGGNYSTYSSILGIPMSGTSSSKFIDYNVKIPSTYLHLDCSAGKAIPPHDPDLSIAKIEAQGERVYWLNGFRKRANTTLNDLKPFSFVYGSWSCPYICCSITTTYVELDIICPALSTCSTARMRRSLLDHPPSAWTLMETGSYGNVTSPVKQRNSDNKTNWNIFLDRFLVMGAGITDFKSPIDDYLGNPETPHSSWDKERVVATVEDYSVRLAQLMNALWFCMNTDRAITQGLSDKTYYLNSTDVSFAWESFPYRYGGLDGIAWPAVGTRSTKTSIIVAHKDWVAALAIASVVLIFSSLIPFILRSLLTKGPDLMMNISSLATRNNPYIPLPANGTFLDASDRSRLLKDLTLRFGEVDGRTYPGRLAIASLDGHGGLNVARVRKGYIYK